MAELSCRWRDCGLEVDALSLSGELDGVGVVDGEISSVGGCGGDASAVLQVESDADGLTTVVTVELFGNLALLRGIGDRDPPDIMRASDLVTADVQVCRRTSEGAEIDHAGLSASSLRATPAERFGYTNLVFNGMGVPTDRYHLELEARFP